MIISSRENRLVKTIAGYLAGRIRKPWVVVEGRKSVREMLDLGLKPAHLIVTQEHDHVAEAYGALTIVTAPLFKALSTVREPQGILAVFEVKETPVSELACRPGMLLVLDGIQDPGNVGTIIRTAAAFDAAGVILGSGCASPYSPKTSRSSTGTVARVAICQVRDSATAIAALAEARRWIAAVPAGGKTPAQCRLGPDCGLILGGEGAGLSDAMLRRADALVTIPISVESLNVAVAAGILMHEARRAP
ncbi:MAG: RNA methyltransferase [Acidobacteriota bacterium]